MGSGAKAEVISKSTGVSYFVKKHIGQPKYEDITLDVDSRVTRKRYDGIATFFLSPNLKQELGCVKIYDLAVLRLGDEQSEFGAEQIRRLTAKHCCERMEF